MVWPKTKMILFNNQFNWLYILMQLIYISVIASFFYHQYSASKCNMHYDAGEHNMKLGRANSSRASSLLHFTLFYFSLDDFSFLLGYVRLHWLFIGLSYIIIFSELLHSPPNPVFVNIMLLGSNQNQESRELGKRIKFLWDIPLYQGHRVIYADEVMWSILNIP